MVSKRETFIVRQFGLALAALVLTSISPLSAQTIRKTSHLVPSGKGWGVERSSEPESSTGHVAAHDLQSQGKSQSEHGISYHGGPVMAGNVEMYFVWYGNWSNGPKKSDSHSTVSLLSSLYGHGGWGGSGHALINSTYSDQQNTVSGEVTLGKETFDNYSRGKKLSDAAVRTVVANEIKSGRLPKDGNGLYVVLTSSDVSESSGFCTRYCGWHDHTRLSDTDVKVIFVGNPDRCGRNCEAQMQSPNGDSGADAMASVLHHETTESLTDPDMNAWYDNHGLEVGDKCAWMWGPVQGKIGYGAHNQTFAGYHWLLQMTWENSRGGGCTQTKGGPFYNR